MLKTCSLFPNDGRNIEYKDSLAFIWRIQNRKGSVLKSIEDKEGFRKVFVFDDHKYLLPFYLFLALCLYLIGFICITGEMKGIIKGLAKHPCTSFLLPYSSIINISLSSPRTGLDWLHLYFDVSLPYFSLVFTRNVQVTCFLFDWILQTILLVLLCGFRYLGAFQIVKKFNYAFLSPNMRMAPEPQRLTFLILTTMGLSLLLRIMIAFYLFTTI